MGLRRGLKAFGEHSCANRGPTLDPLLIHVYFWSREIMERRKNEILLNNRSASGIIFY